MGNIKQINIKNRTYYFFNDINIMGFNSCLIKINKKYYKNICICKSGYIAIIKIDDYESINNVNLLYLIIRKADEYIEENNGKTYLVLLLQITIQKFQQNLQNFGMKLNILLRQ